MIRKGIILASAISVFLSVSGIMEAEVPVEVRIGIGGWTLSPFHSMVESRCEDIVQNEFYMLLNSALPDEVLSPIRADIDLSSSGRTFYAEIWIPLGQSRFALGLRGDLFSFRIPFTASASETVRIFGYPLADLSGQGTGTVRLDGFGLSLLGRWKILSSRRFDLAVRAGLSVLPFRGRITMDQTLLARTPLGDYFYSDSLDQSIAEIREVNDSIPSLIVAPLAGIDIGYRLSPRWSLFANLSVSHGTFYSAGISASF